MEGSRVEIFSLVTVTSFGELFAFIGGKFKNKKSLGGDLGLFFGLEAPT